MGVDRFKRRPCVCYNCGSQAQLSINGAKLLGWSIWLGGARCPLCKKKQVKVPERRRNEYKFR